MRLFKIAAINFLDGSEPIDFLLTDLTLQGDPEAGLSLSRKSI
jgi:hypothetical protein